MAEETDLTIQILRQIQATQAEHTRMLNEHTAEFASLKEALRVHGVRLDTNTENFEDVLRKITTDLVKRVRALESLQQ